MSEYRKIECQESKEKVTCPKCGSDKVTYQICYYEDLDANTNESFGIDDGNRLDHYVCRECDNDF